MWREKSSKRLFGDIGRAGTVLYLVNEIGDNETVERAGISRQKQHRRWLRLGLWCDYNRIPPARTRYFLSHINYKTREEKRVYNFLLLFRRHRSWQSAALCVLAVMTQSPASNDEIVLKMKKFLKQNFIYICLAIGCLSLVSSLIARPYTTSADLSPTLLFHARGGNLIIILTELWTHHIGEKKCV